MTEYGIQDSYAADDDVPWVTGLSSINAAMEYVQSLPEYIPNEHCDGFPDLRGEGFQIVERVGDAWVLRVRV
jgi:hypothetical protein